MWGSAFILRGSLSGRVVDINKSGLLLQARRDLANMLPRIASRGLDGDHCTSTWSFLPSVDGKAVPVGVV